MATDRLRLDNMVLRLTALAGHQPETAIRVVVALEHGHQSVASAGRTGAEMKLNAERHDGVVVECHRRLLCAILPPYAGWFCKAAHER